MAPINRSDNENSTSSLFSAKLSGDTKTSGSIEINYPFLVTRVMLAMHKEQKKKQQKNRLCSYIQLHRVKQDIEINLDKFGACRTSN